MLLALNWCLLLQPPSQILTNTFFKGTRQPICKHSFSSKIYFPPCLGNLMMHRKYLKKKFPFPVTSLHKDANALIFYNMGKCVFIEALFTIYFSSFSFPTRSPNYFLERNCNKQSQSYCHFQGNVTSNRMCIAEKLTTHLYILTHSHCSVQ